MDSKDSKNVDFPPLGRKKRKKLTPAGIAVVVIFFLLCAWLGYWIAGLVFEPIVPVEKEKDEKSEEELTYKSSEILNVLLLGIDQREDEPARADTIILASLDVKNRDVTLLSIPRDTRVRIPGKGITRKINYSHAAGGIPLTVETVEKFLGLPVHYYVETNFQGFSSMLDVLGGITINVEGRMYKPEEGINLKAGMQKLNGHDALAYVRWRDDGRGDIGRIERQQKFFKALSSQALSFSTVWKIPDLLQELNKHVKTDMKVQKMLQIANRFKDLDNIEITTYMVPGVPDDVNYGASYWIADEQALQDVLEKIYDQKSKNDSTGLAKK